MDNNKKPIETRTFSREITQMDGTALLKFIQEINGAPQMDPPESSVVSLRNILNPIFKHKIEILLFFSAVVITVAIGTLRTQPVYEATAQVLVNMGRQNMYLPASGSMAPILDFKLERQMNTEIEILNSRSLAEKTLAALGPAIIYQSDDNQDQGPLKKFRQTIGELIDRLKGEVRRLLKLIFPEKRKARMPVDIDEEYAAVLAALPRFRKDLSIQAVEDSNLISVSFEHEDPYMAAKVVNKLAAIYFGHHLEVHKKPQSTKFFQEQVRLLEEKARQAEDNLESLKEQHNIISLYEERSLLLEREADLLADLNRHLSEETETEKRIQLLRKQLDVTPISIAQAENIYPDQGLISSLETKLVELEIKENELKSKYTAISNLPELKRVKEEINVVQKSLKESEKRQHKSKQSGENPTYRRLLDEILHNEAELKALRAKTEVQKAQLSEYRKNLIKFNQIESELKRLEQAVEVNREKYQLYLTKFEEARISDAMDTQKMASVSLMESAHPPLRPIVPSLLLNLLFAGVVGAVGGIGLTFCLEYFNDTLGGVEDVEKFLQLPVLGSIPELEQ